MGHDGCNWSRCRRLAVVGYGRRGLCLRHWELFCEWDDAGQISRALAKIGLKRRPAYPRKAS